VRAPPAGFSGVIEFARKLGRFGVAASLAALCATAVNGQEGEAASADSFNIPDNVTLLGTPDTNVRKATATVNGALITRTDVDQRVALILDANNAKDVPEDELKRLRLQVLRNLIDETLQIQEARAQEMEVTQDEVDQTYQRLAAEKYNRSLPEMEAHLRSAGSSPNSLKQQIQGELAWDRLLRRNVTPFVNVSSDEINELYERVVSSKGTAEYRIGEIYLSANPTNRAAVAENAKRIVEQLREGASFVAYARQFSESSTASQGGDLGWIRLEQLQNPQLEGIVREMGAGQLAGPIEIPGGFDILYLIDKRQIGMADPRDAVLSLKQISIDFPKDMSEDAARQRAESFAAGVKEIRGCGDVEAQAAKLGAQVVANDQMPARSLPDALQSALLQLSVGQATPPFGSLEEGVRVLMLCGREDPQVAAAPDREQIAQSVEEERVQKRAQRYLRDLRRDAVIEYN
jgi:peptidyl-prolyl cis-trans isomerase SurA